MSKLQASLRSEFSSPDTEMGPLKTAGNHSHYHNVNAVNNVSKD